HLQPTASRRHRPGPSARVPHRDCHPKTAPARSPADRGRQPPVKEIPMFRRTLSLTTAILVIAVAACAGITTASAADGGKKLITIIVNDPSNPYWKAEADVAEKTAKELGYRANVAAHYGDTKTERQLI